MSNIKATIKVGEKRFIQWKDAFFTVVVKAVRFPGYGRVNYVVEPESGVGQAVVEPQTLLTDILPVPTKEK